MKYRIHWSASSNITFNGSTDWPDEDEPSSNEVLEGALEASGFECWVEEVEDDVDG